MDVIENKVNNKQINRGDLLEYSFYDDTQKVIAVLNERKLKEFLDADEIILHEYEHK